MVLSGYFFASLAKFLARYSGLFEQREREQDEGIAKTSSGFHEHWGWYTTLDEVSGGDVLKFDSILKMNVVEFLNWLAYLKDKKKWQEQQAMSQKL